MRFQSVEGIKSFVATAYVALKGLFLGVNTNVDFQAEDRQTDLGSTRPFLFVAFTQGTIVSSVLMDPIVAENLT